MNLLQIKQKMFELGVSDSYMSDACGVGIHYFKQCTMGSKPMTKVLEQKIKGVLKSLEISKNKEQREKEEFEKALDDVTMPEPQMLVVEKPKDVMEDKEKEEALPLEFLKGQINGLNRARRIVRSNISDQALVHREAIDILLSLDDELEAVVNSVLENRG